MFKITPKTLISKLLEIYVFPFLFMVNPDWMTLIVCDEPINSVEVPRKRKTRHFVGRLSGLGGRESARQGLRPGTVAGVGLVAKSDNLQ